METIIDTGTYTNNPSGQFHPDEHMRLISQTQAIRSSPSTNARHMPDTDLAEVSEWSGQGTTSVGRLGMSDRQRVETVRDLGGTSRLGLASSNTVGKGWDPGPPREVQNKPQEYKWRLAQEGGYADGETANSQSPEENEWKAPAVKMRCTCRTTRYVETVGPMYTAQDDRPGLINHQQATLRLHWLTPLRKGGGTGDGLIGANGL